MKIVEIRRDDKKPTSAPIVLEKDGWDDNGRYETLYRAYLYDGSKHHEIGKVRIGFYGQPEKPDTAGITSLPNKELDVLPDGWFSFGTDEDYYEAIFKHGREVAGRFLRSLNDICLSDVSYDKALLEPVFKWSFFRSCDREGFAKLRRMAEGDDRKTPFTALYSRGDVKMEFGVSPDSVPSTNIHSIIGSNGAGKSLILKDILKIAAASEGSLGKFTINKTETGIEVGINKLIYISYSVFDDQEIASIVKGSKNKHLLDYIGISSVRTTDENSVIENDDCLTAHISLQDKLTKDFVDYLTECSFGFKRERWTRALQNLQVDSAFKEMNLASLLASEGESFKEEARRLFRSCSSGHAIVLLIVTALIAKIEERNLILLDEPETHLHPPLLAALLNCIGELVADRNGIVLTVTHSPVVVQELPEKCVWMISRFGQISKAYRPRLETYGENLSRITEEVFRLEMRMSGFHKVIKSLADSGDSYEEICEKLPSLGSEALTLAMILSDGDGDS